MCYVGPLECELKERKAYWEARERKVRRFLSVISTSLERRCDPCVNRAFTFLMGGADVRNLQLTT